MPTSFIDKHSLPPVTKRTPPQRPLQYVVSHPEPADSNQATNHLTLPRTDSLPPAYNDLFGIETIPCSQNQASSNRSSEHLPPPTRAPTPPNNRRETDTPSQNLSPEEQLQQLLKQMLPRSQPATPGLTEEKRHKPRQIPSKPAKKPPAYAAAIPSNYPHANSSSRGSNNTAEWDDQRAQDLFQQLMRL
jgi:hypothetical protein